MHPDPAFRSCAIPEAEEGPEANGTQQGEGTLSQRQQQQQKQKQQGPLITLGQVCSLL